MPKLHSIPGTKEPTPVPTIAIATSEKQLKQRRQERALAEPHGPDPEVDAFFARNVRPGGAVPPWRKP